MEQFIFPNKETLFSTYAPQKDTGKPVVVGRYFRTKEGRGGGSHHHRESLMQNPLVYTTEVRYCRVPNEKAQHSIYIHPLYKKAYLYFELPIVFGVTFPQVKYVMLSWLIAACGHNGYPRPAPLPLYTWAISPPAVALAWREDIYRWEDQH